MTQHSSQSDQPFASQSTQEFAAASSASAPSFVASLRTAAFALLVDRALSA